jgi:tRNA pseudouridine38-40 synthase
MTLNRIALGLEYDGSTFCGWQTQPSGCSVQDHVERALAGVAGAPVATVCAGRTDAGVHALAQVVHFDAPVERPETAWVRGGNAMLPPTIALTWARVVPAEFHARYSALRRRYRYVLLNRSVRPGTDARRVGWFHLPLDADRMQTAARALVGEHDFSTFRSSECQARSPVRTIHAADIRRSGDYVIMDFDANAFLHHMVRNVVGALVHVGKGARDPGWIAELLHAKDRKVSAPTFDAAGLYLAGVEYDRAFGLPTSGGAAWAVRHATGER